MFYSNFYISEFISKLFSTRTALTTLTKTKYLWKSAFYADLMFLNKLNLKLQGKTHMLTPQ